MSLDDSKLTMDVMTDFNRIFKGYGIDLKKYKLSFIKRRLDRRMSMLNISEYTKYAEILNENHQEFEEILSSLSINVTNFFRDDGMFDAFKLSVLPRLISDMKSGEKIRIWSAGCATGEEAYSIAIMINQAIGKSNNVDIEIVANDVNKSAIQFAQCGRYSKKNITNLPCDVITNNFCQILDDKNDVQYEIVQNIKNMITFRHGDILSYPVKFFDVIFCRNVLIYYEPEAQELILAKFHNSLKNTGYLILGMDETMFGRRCQKLFHPLMLRERIYQKISTC